MRNICPVLLLLIVLVSGSDAVVDKPALRDSLQSDTAAGGQDGASPFGAATSFMMGNTLLEQGDLAGAVPYLAQAYHMDPDELEIAETYRDVLIELDYPDEALAISRRLLRSSGLSYDVNEVHVLLLVGLERYDDALAHLAGFQTQFPDSTRLHLLEGEILLRASRFEEARKKYISLRRMFPEKWERLTLTLLEISALIDDPDRQEALWADAYSERPDSSALRLGYIRFLVNHARDARALEIAIGEDGALSQDISPLGVSWTTLVAGLISDAGRSEVALEFLEDRRRETDLDADSALLAARLRIRSGDLEAALEVLSEGVADWPEDPALHLLLGEVYAETGRYDLSETHLRESLALDETETGAYFSLISLLSRKHPADLDPRSDAPATRAVIAEIRNLAERAESRLDAGDYSGYMMLGATMMGIGDPASAAEKYEIAAGRRCSTCRSSTRNWDGIRTCWMSSNSCWTNIPRIRWLSTRWGIPWRTGAWNWTGPVR